MKTWKGEEEGCLLGAWTKLVLLSLQRRNLGSIAKVLQHAAAGKLVSLL